jgi:hypothetical protein
MTPKNGAKAAPVTRLPSECLHSQAFKVTNTVSIAFG